MDEPQKTARPRWQRLILYVVAAALVIVGAKYLRKYVVLDNFGEVETGKIYRSGQLQPYQMEKLIRTLGIKTVINTREPNARPDIVRREQEVCDRNGVRMVWLPMPGDGMGTYQQYDEAIAILSEQTNLPVIVHCARGSYRTGAIIASYRVLVEGWSEEDAVREMYQYRAHLENHRLLPYLLEYFRQRRPDQQGVVSGG
ncbi:MAG TPA: tyrosine-protein phosphatase [Kiritimatiellia bacterium]|nr:tyrosine-protein phosphatase [Kiritimatiellia bacterium]